jgi:hypothetical protein
MLVGWEGGREGGRGGREGGGEGGKEYFSRAHWRIERVSARANTKVEELGNEREKRTKYEGGEKGREEGREGGREGGRDGLTGSVRSCGRPGPSSWLISSTSRRSFAKPCRAFSAVMTSTTRPMLTSSAWGGRGERKKLEKLRIQKFIILKFRTGDGQGNEE